MSRSSVDDEEIEETGEQVIENVIQDEITYTINKEWIEMDDKDVRFAIYQQGPNAENKLVRHRDAGGDSRYRR